MPHRSAGFALFRAPVPAIKSAGALWTAACAVRRRIVDMHRRAVLLGASALGFCLAAAPFAWAANPAEDFVATNIQAGFNILNDSGAGAAERRQRFADFLIGL